MNKAFFLLVVSIVLSNCIIAQVKSTNYESETLKIEQVSSSVFIHISYLSTNDFGKVACNGMVYFDEEEAIVFDTPTDDTVSKELIHWIENQQKKKVKAIVVTHFHVDCLGGLQYFHEKGIPSHANNTTITLARQHNRMVVPEHGFENKMKITIGKFPVFTQFFGEGHTVDNVVGYVPNEKVLFGGCLIKSNTAGKGNLEDANTEEWSNTIEKIKKKIPDLKIVIPGHGKSGGTELLDYTIQMFNH